MSGFVFAPPGTSDTASVQQQQQQHEQHESISKDNVPRLLAHAEDLVARHEIDAAKRFFEAAISAAPDDPEVLDAFGVFLLNEYDDLELGAELLRRSVEVAPEDPLGFAKYMSLGQVTEGLESAKLFESGAQLMQNRLLALQQEAEQHSQGTAAAADPAAAETIAEIEAEGEQLRALLSAAYCQWAELYLTDLCDEEGAEQQCEALVDAALSASNDTAGPYRVLADLRLSQQRPDDALAALQTCHAFWKDTDDLDDRPSVELRDSCARMFIELGRPSEAIDIFEQLIEEDDTVAEVHHMLGVAYRAAGDPVTAVECLEQAQTLLTAAGCTDPDILREVDEILTEVREEAAHAPAAEDHADKIDEDMG